MPADVDDIVVLDTTTDFPEMVNTDSAGDPIDTPYPGLDRTKHRDADAWNVLVAAFVVVQEALQGIKTWLFGGSEGGVALADADSFLFLDATDSTVKRGLLSRISTYIQSAVPIAWGTYTPTATLTTNVDAATPAESLYVRVGTIVLGGGYISIDPTAASNIEVQVTLPVASNFSGAENAVGVLQSGASSSGNRVFADTTTDRLRLLGVATGTSNATWVYLYAYKVI